MRRLRTPVPAVSSALSLLAALLAGPASVARAAPTTDPATQPASPAVSEPSVIKLPGPADRLRTGGAGRYLVFHVAGTEKLTVVDAVEGKVVKQQVPAPGDFHYAATRD